MNNEKDFLGKEPIGKLLWSLAIPTITAQLINMLYNIVDRIYIGHIPASGAMALTGVGVCMPLIMIVSAFAALVGSGGAPRASIHMGRKDYDQAEKILGNCFTLQLLISAILTVVLFCFNRKFLLAFGASENTIEYAVSYMNIYSLGTVFVELTLGMNMFITAQGFAKTGMLSVLIGAVCNIVLDPVFIFGMNLGVRGAAIATVISQACSTIWVLTFLTGSKTRLKIRLCNMGLTPSVILPCMALGAATFVMQSSESIISICFNSSLLKYGGDIAVGAMTILTSAMQFAMLPLQGLDRARSRSSATITELECGTGKALLGLSFEGQTLPHSGRLILACQCRCGSGRYLPGCSILRRRASLLHFQGTPQFIWPVSLCSEFRLPAQDGFYRHRSCERVDYCG
ncbi:MAG: MATE family efflux transporter [Clostridium sp.]